MKLLRSRFKTNRKKFFITQRVSNVWNLLSQEAEAGSLTQWLGNWTNSWWKGPLVMECSRHGCSLCLELPKPMNAGGCNERGAKNGKFWACPIHSPLLLRCLPLRETEYWARSDPLNGCFYVCCERRREEVEGFILFEYLAEVTYFARPIY